MIYPFHLKQSQEKKLLRDNSESKNLSNLLNLSFGNIKVFNKTDKDKFHTKYDNNFIPIESEECRFGVETTSH